MTCEFKAPSYRPLMFHSNYSFQNFPGGPGTCWHNYNNHAYPFKINVYVNVDWHQTCISCAFIMCIRICVYVWLCVCVYIHVSILASVGNNSDCKFAALRVCEALKWSKSRFNFTATGSQLALSRNTTHADAIDAQRWWPQANNNVQPWPNNPIKFI